MNAIDPSARWDGQRWWHWDGRQWRPEQSGGSATRLLQTPPFQPSGGILVDKRDHKTMAIIAWVLAVLSLGYFLPWAVAATRGKSNAGAIGWLNLLLGWTFIGWVAALVMACSAHQVAGVAANLTVVNQALGSAFPVAPSTTIAGPFAPALAPAQPAWSSSPPAGWAKVPPPAPQPNGESQ